MLRPRNTNRINKGIAHKVKLDKICRFSANTNAIEKKLVVIGRFKLDKKSLFREVLMLNAYANDLTVES